MSPNSKATEALQGDHLCDMSSSSRERKKASSDGADTLTPAEQLMGRGSEMQRPTPRPNRGLQSDLVEHELP